MVAEIELLKYLRLLTDYLIYDLDNAPTEEDSILYDIFGATDLDGVSLFIEAKELFKRKKTHPEKLKFHLYFTGKVSSLPSITLQVPSTTSDDSMNSLGVGEGDDYSISSDGSTQNTVNRNFSSNINILIASKNVIEQIILQKTYLSLLIMILQVLDMKGFRKPILSTKEVQISQELIASGLYTRILTLAFTERVEIAGVRKYRLLQDILFERTSLYEKGNVDG